jgi:hypothetical protein
MAGRRDPQISQHEGQTGVTTLLKRLLESCCLHRFSWPHTSVNGQDYQVCLICGAVYEFDCTTMRRTGRLVAPANSRYDSLPGK